MSDRPEGTSSRKPAARQGIFSRVTGAVSTVAGGVVGAASTVASGVVGAGRMVTDYVGFTAPKPPAKAAQDAPVAAASAPASTTVVAPSSPAAAALSPQLHDIPATVTGVGTRYLDDQQTKKGSRKPASVTRSSGITVFNPAATASPKPSDFFEGIDAQGATEKSPFGNVQPASDDSLFSGMRRSEAPEPVLDSIEEARASLDRGENIFGGRIGDYLTPNSPGNTEVFERPKPPAEPKKSTLGLTATQVAESLQASVVEEPAAAPTPATTPTRPGSAAEAPVVEEALSTQAPKRGMVAKIKDRYYKKREEYARKHSSAEAQAKWAEKRAALATSYLSPAERKIVSVATNREAAAVTYSSAQIARDQVNERFTNIKDMAAKARATLGELDKLKKERAGYLAQQAKLEPEITRLQGEVGGTGTLTTQMTALEGQINAAKIEIRRLTENASARQVTLFTDADFVNAARNHKRSLSTTHDDLEKKSAELDKLLADQVKLKTEINTKKARLGQLDTSYNRLQGSIERLDKGATEGGDTIAYVQAEVQRLAAALDAQLPTQDIGKGKVKRTEKSQLDLLRQMVAAGGDVEKAAKAKGADPAFAALIAQRTRAVQGLADAHRAYRKEAKAVVKTREAILEEDLARKGLYDVQDGRNQRFLAARTEYDKATVTLNGAEDGVALAQSALTKQTEALAKARGGLAALDRTIADKTKEIAAAEAINAVLEEHNVTTFAESETALAKLNREKQALVDGHGVVNPTTQMGEGYTTHNTDEIAAKDAEIRALKNALAGIRDDTALQAQLNKPADLQTELDGLLIAKQRTFTAVTAQEGVVTQAISTLERVKSERDRAKAALEAAKKALERAEEALDPIAGAQAKSERHEYLTAVLEETSEQYLAEVSALSDKVRKGQPPSIAAQLRSAKSTIVSLDKAIRSDQSAIAAAEQAVTAAKTKRDRISRQIEDLKKRHDAQSKERRAKSAKLKKDFEDAESTLRTIESSQREIRTTMAALEEKGRKSSTELESLRKYTNLIADADQQLLTATRKLEAAQAAYNSYTPSSSSIRSELTILNGQRAVAQSDVDAKSQDLAMKEAEVRKKNLAGHRAQVLQRITELKTQLQTAREFVNAYEAMRAELNSITPDMMVSRDERDARARLDRAKAARYARSGGSKGQTTDAGEGDRDRYAKVKAALRGDGQIAAYGAGDVARKPAALFRSKAGTSRDALATATPMLQGSPLLAPALEAAEGRLARLIRYVKTKFGKKPQPEVFTITPVEVARQADSLALPSAVSPRSPASSVSAVSVPASPRRKAREAEDIDNPDVMREVIQTAHILYQSGVTQVGGKGPASPPRTPGRTQQEREQGGGRGK